MKNFTKELKAIIKEDPGAPIMSPDEVIGRANTMVVLTNDAPRELLALAGPSRKAILLNFKPLMITFPDQKGVYKVQPDDIVFENHHTGRDVTEAGSEETAYEKFFASAMKKFGVSSPIDLSPEDTKKFFNYVDKNWEAEEESDGSKTEILPAIGAAVGGVARAAGAGLGAGLASAVTGDDNEDVSTGKVGKKDKGSYQHAYKLALKKYQIHSADELDTPAERKGFTAYVDKLWKGGEVKDHALPEAKGEEKARRKEAERKERERREKTQAANVKKRVAGSDKTTAEKARERDAAEREKRQAKLKTKLAQQKTKREDPAKARDDRAAELRKRQSDLDAKQREMNKDKKPDKKKPGFGQQKQKQQQKKKKKQSKFGKKMGVGGGFGGALSKISGAAKQQAAKYKATGN